MTKIKKLKQKLSRGSILVFTLMVLFILLVSALGIASVTVIERKNAGTTGKSTQSFQVADSGAEIVLQKIYKDDLRTVGELAGVLSCSVSDGIAVISGSIATGKEFKITFEDDSGSDIVSCADNTTEIRRIKSVGSYARTKRAIEVAVAQAFVDNGCIICDIASSDSTKICSILGDVNSENVCADGDGCTISAIQGYNGGALGINDPRYFYQRSDDQWGSLKIVDSTRYSGTNGDSTADQFLFQGPDSINIYDDDITIETSKDEFSVENPGGNNVRVLICD